MESRLNRTVRPEALADAAQARDWYDRQRAGLGTEFLTALDATLDWLMLFPEGCPVIKRGTRRALLRRFPYLVLYRIEGDTLVVIGVFHQRQSPKRWDGRR